MPASFLFSFLQIFMDVIEHLADTWVSPFRFMAASKILGEEAANAAGAGAGAGAGEKEKGKQK